MRTLFLCTFAALALVACQKNDPQQVTYKANCGGAGPCNVEWLAADGSTQNISLPNSSIWEGSAVMEQGDRVYIKVTSQDTLMNNPSNVWVFVNGDPIATYSTGTHAVPRDSSLVNTVDQNQQPISFWRYWKSAVIDRALPE